MMWCSYIQMYSVDGTLLIM